jgi:hypothetical protein
MASPETSSLEGRLLSRASRAAAGSRAAARADRHSGTSSILSRATARHAARAVARSERAGGLPGLGLAALLSRRLGEGAARSGFGSSWGGWADGFEASFVTASPPWMAAEIEEAPFEAPMAAPYRGARVVPTWESSTVARRAAGRSPLAAASGHAVPARPLTAGRAARGGPALPLAALARSATPAGGAPGIARTSDGSVPPGFGVAAAPRSWGDAPMARSLGGGIQLSRSVAWARATGGASPAAGRQASPALARAASRGAPPAAGAQASGGASALARAADPAAAPLRRSGGIAPGGRGFAAARLARRAELAFGAPDLTLPQPAPASFLGAPTADAPAGAWTSAPLARAAAAAPTPRGLAARAAAPGSRAASPTERAARLAAAAGPPPLARALAGGGAAAGPGARALARSMAPFGGGSTPSMALGADAGAFFGAPRAVGRPAFGLTRSAHGPSNFGRAQLAEAGVVWGAEAPASSALGHLARRSTGRSGAAGARSAFEGRTLRSSLATSALALAAPPALARALGMPEAEELAGSPFAGAPTAAPSASSARPLTGSARATTAAARPADAAARRRRAAIGGAAPPTVGLRHEASPTLPPAAPGPRRASVPPTAVLRALIASGPELSSGESWIAPGAGGALGRAASRGAPVHALASLPAQRTAARAVATPEGPPRRSSLAGPDLALADAGAFRAASFDAPGDDAPLGVSASAPWVPAPVATPRATAWSGAPTGTASQPRAAGASASAAPGAGSRLTRDATTGSPSARALRRSEGAVVLSPFRGAGPPAARAAARRGGAAGPGGQSVARSLSTAETLGLAPSVRRSRALGAEPIFAQPAPLTKTGAPPADTAPARPPTAGGSALPTAPRGDRAGRPAARSPLRRSFERLGALPATAASAAAGSPVLRGMERSALAAPGQARPLTASSARALRAASSAPGGHPGLTRSLQAPAPGALAGLPAGLFGDGDSASTATAATATSARPGAPTASSRATARPGAPTAGPGSRAAGSAAPVAGSVARRWAGAPRGVPAEGNWAGASTAEARERGWVGAPGGAARPAGWAGAPTGTSDRSEHGGAPVARALSRASEATTPVGGPLQRGGGYRGERGLLRASAAALAGLPTSLVVPDPTLPEAEGGAPSIPGRAGAATGARGGWTGAPTASPAGRTDRAERRAAAGGALPKAGAPDAGRGTRRGPVDGDLPAGRDALRRSASGAPVGLALRRALQRDPDALVRALGAGFGFGRVEDLALPPGVDPGSPEATEAAAPPPARAHIGAPVVRQARGSGAASSPLPQRASRRGDVRSHKGPRISQRAIARLAELSGGEGLTGLDEGALASAAGLVDRAVRRQAARSEDRVERSSHVTPVMALPEAEFRSLLRAEMADLTTISAPAPAVHREILEAAARLEEAAKVQRAPDASKGPGPGGKKDLEDFLRRAIRQIGLREDIERSRDLTPWD